METILRKVKEEKLGYAIFGKLIFFFALGSIFSIQLVQYGYIILAVSTLFVVSFLNGSFIYWYKKKPLSYMRLVMGFLGGYLLVLFFGIQSPQVGIKTILLIVGLLLMLPALWEVVRK